MAITGYRKGLVDWNATGNNSKLKLSKANIRRETDLIEKCKACYRDDGVPLPKDIVASIILTLRKIRNASTFKVKDDARNAVATAARSDLRKKARDPNQYLDEAEQVAYKNDRASMSKTIAKGTELRKRDADPKQHLDKADQARMKKLKVHDDTRNATKKAIRVFKRTLQGRMLRRLEDTVHGQSLFLPIVAGAFIVAELALSALKMTFGGERNANKIIHRLRSLFHLSNTPPKGKNSCSDRSKGRPL